MINITGLKKEDVLVALYNRAKTQGLGILQYEPEDMTFDEAKSLLSQYTDFDYVKGRVIKVNLENDTEFCPENYDRDNGVNAAKEVIDKLFNPEDS